ncbi:Ldh family oxidoreductase [Jiangella mangrovi]|uniref:LDH2 family malate/lactate/ureidoglycolate dehydrogenase n=1 Tax=Jiangella mangrovi TaxID=1524084 RepID=A0A7W9LPD0_9ACTN|nr:Ldh family oxidoreductase [Jiangella mangrovi]MBB5791245.1 LDH2 family malate/lactate/ureidoglycolate dehydrogenase [Jiangella mangrovi]
MSAVEATVTRVGAAELRAAVHAALTAAGAVPDEAAVQAEQLVEGDLRGHPSHGVRRLPVLVTRLRAGLIVSGAGVGCEWRTPGLAVVDGRRGFGPVVARHAAGLAVERAATQGVAVAAVRGSGHVGMLAPYLETMVDGDCVALVLTISEALVHPWGGARAMVGTNPVGIGVPTGGDPLILDMSTGAVSMGRILDHAAREEAIPLGWAIDAAGAPTTDATAAAGGAISPFGGPKGYALGVALETLVAALTGSALGAAVTGTLDTEHPSTKGDVFVAFSVDAMGLAPRLAGIAGYLDDVRASGDGAPVTVPGDRARATRERHLRDGVPVDAAVWRQVRELAEETE